MITQDEIKSIWKYLPDTDSFIWSKSQTHRAANSPVRAIDRVNINGKEYRYSRLKNLYLNNTPYMTTLTQVSDPITIKQLRKILQYDASTGIFTWIEPRQYTTKVGDVAGSIENTGYISIRINKVSYLAHRLAWFYCFEEWPESYIDHIDRDKTNNALDNLREATAFENSRNRAINKNNSSGYPGVYKRGSKWRAEIVIKGIKKKNTLVLLVQRMMRTLHILNLTQYLGIKTLTLDELS